MIVSGCRYKANHLLLSFYELCLCAYPCFHCSASYAAGSSAALINAVGSTVAATAEPTYDLSYDDGDAELKVPGGLIRLVSGQGFSPFLILILLGVHCKCMVLNLF